jgi:hypothetical protein
MNKVSLNIPELLYSLTGQAGWQATEGKQSGTGVDYHYRMPNGKEAYINLEEDVLLVVVETNVIYSGTIAKKWIQPFVTVE